MTQGKYINCVKTKGAEPLIDDWFDASPMDGAVRGWEPWSIYVRLAQMPDGSVRPIGLRIEPRDDYEGSIRDQRITVERLRQFPLGVVTAEARFREALSRLPEGDPEATDDQEVEPWTWETLHAHLADFDGPLEELDAILRFLDVQVAKMDAADAARAEFSAKAEADLEVRVRQIYRDGGLTEHEIDLIRVSDHYRDALRNPEVKSPRRRVADAMGVSVTTVDRLLRKARTTGHLEPYDGAQGRHGKPVNSNDLNH